MKSLRPFVVTTLLLISIHVSATTIEGVTLSGTQLTITGVGFAGTPLKVMFNGSSIPVVSNTSTQIIATLNPVPSPGSYLVVVKSGSATGYSVFAVSASASIVAQVALTNQMNQIPLTTLVTPAQNSLYRVSGYMDCSGLNVDFSFMLYWADANGSKTNNDNTPNCSGGEGYTNWNYTVSDTLGSPLSYAVNGSSGTFDIFVSVEQLQ